MQNDTRFGLDRKTQLLGPVQLDSGVEFAPVDFAYERRQIQRHPDLPRADR